jgi:hypothetical protein
MRRLVFVLSLLMVVGVAVDAGASNLIVRGTDDTYGYQLIYDSDRNITWYDFTYNSSSWDDAMNWALKLEVTFNGVTYKDWRLPTSLGPDGTGPGPYNYDRNSEMGHQYYVEWGNAAGGGPHNYAPFTNIARDWYWSSTELGSDYAYYFMFANGWQWDDPKWAGHRALAVRNGDVPIPGAVWLLGSGLLGLVGLKRKFLG